MPAPVGPQPGLADAGAKRNETVFDRRRLALERRRSAFERRILNAETKERVGADSEKNPTKTYRGVDLGKVAKKAAK